MIVNFRNNPTAAEKATAKAHMIRSLINTSENQFFSVVFYKKDHSLRKMTARLHVRKGVKGTSKYDRAKSETDNGIITVWDSGKLEFRRINLNTVVGLKVKGMSYSFMEGSDPDFEVLKELLNSHKIEFKVTVETTVH